MTTTTRNFCAARVPKEHFFGMRGCQNFAITPEGFCNIHDPARIAKKQAAKDLERRNERTYRENLIIRGTELCKAVGVDGHVTYAQDGPRHSVTISFEEMKKLIARIQLLEKGTQS